MPRLAETLCIQEDRVVDRANTVSRGRLKLQLPQSPLRAHYVKARVRPSISDASLAVFHGPRCIARFDADGQHQADRPNLPKRDIVLDPSRTLRAACGGGLRPSLTASARDVPVKSQVGTKKRPPGQNKNSALPPVNPDDDRPWAPYPPARPPLQSPGQIPSGQVMCYQTGQLD